MDDTGACLSTPCRELGGNDQEKQRGAQQCCRFRSVGIVLLSRVELGGGGGGRQPRVWAAVLPGRTRGGWMWTDGWPPCCLVENPRSEAVRTRQGRTRSWKRGGRSRGSPEGCRAGRWRRSTWRRAAHGEEAKRGAVAVGDMTPPSSAPGTAWPVSGAQ